MIWDRCSKIVLFDVLEHVENDDLFFSAEITNGGEAVLEVDGSTLSITPELNFYGNIDIEVSVTDGDLTDQTTFTVIVSPVNDSMIFNEIDDQLIDEDQTLILDLDVVDVDGPFLSFILEHSGEFEENLILLQYCSTTISLVPYQHWYGSIDVTITAFDGQYTVPQSFNLTVESVNLG